MNLPIKLINVSLKEYGSYALEVYLVHKSEKSKTLSRSYQGVERETELKRRNFKHSPSCSFVVTLTEMIDIIDPSKKK